MFVSYAQPWGKSAHCRSPHRRKRNLVVRHSGSGGEGWGSLPLGYSPLLTFLIVIASLLFLRVVLAFCECDAWVERKWSTCARDKELVTKGRKNAFALSARVAAPYLSCAILQSIVHSSISKFRISLDSLLLFWEIRPAFVKQNFRNGFQLQIF